MNQEKLTEINISQGKKKGGGPSPQDAAKVQGKADKDSFHDSSGENEEYSCLQSMRCGGIQIMETCSRDDWSVHYSTNIPNIHRDQAFKKTHLEERWRLGRGLGVSFLRLCPGERLSPRWPLQETRSLLQDNRN